MILRSGFFSAFILSFGLALGHFALAEEAAPWESLAQDKAPESEAKPAKKMKKKPSKKRHEKEPQSEEASESTSGPESENSTAPKAKLILHTSSGCYVVTFESRPGEIISCKDELPLTYTKRDCATSEATEIGDVEAMVSCQDDRRIGLQFKTSSEALAVSLRVQRQSKGRKGVVTKYVVEGVSKEEGSITKLLSEPTLKDLAAPAAEETPLAFKFSGFAAVEFERTSGFGYSNATDFTKGSSQNNLSLLSDLGFEVGKDQTALVSLLEVGEVYFGDSTTGGGQNTRGNVVKLKNFYLTHQLSQRIGVLGGIAPVVSDPRSFIFNDNVAALQMTYKTDLSEGQLWFAEAAKTSPTLPLAAGMTTS